ncbi:F0F1 ATP synthase subunit delta [Oceanobacillus halophilus]|uniref:ATP synthase subunit delta n=1 Tax=Oceanobacillus halophilus TaxID=930130 RepID=A0A495A452_9BACI|nr:F0F1 ATP synthase subunit delta [Oceanobacillus halophilus]RKQ34375.1 F0F1 ATP synthase subunit delta [Oceanobacillus halophilus]
MSEALVAKRYAEALFTLGQEKLYLDKFVEEFSVVREVFETNEQLVTFLTHPGINNGKKKELIDKSFQGFQKDVVNTIKLLVERHHTVVIPAIIDAFLQRVNDAKGIADATVYSVRELTDDEKLKVKESFVKRLNKQEIRIQNIVDPSLMGGIKIRVGNTIYDGSISGKLKRFERNILTANI